MRDFVQFLGVVLMATVEYTIAIPVIVADFHHGLRSGEFQKAVSLEWVPDFIYALGFTALMPFRVLFWVPDAPVEEQEELLVLSLGGMLAHSLAVTAAAVLLS